MDDKWSAFVEQDRLFLHRSWTGLGIYEAQFAKTGDEWEIREAIVENSQTSYRRASDEIESLCLALIIESVLLNRFHQHDWERWQSMIASEFAGARIPPGKMYAKEGEVLMGPGGHFFDLQQLQEFEPSVWLHVCVGNRWGQRGSDAE
jgi:hypothetical protein